VFTIVQKENNICGKVKKNITPEIMDQIISILSHTFHGNVVLVYQDSRLVQIERNEKIRPVNSSEKGTYQPQGLKPNCDISIVRAKILEAFEQLEYGQIVIVIKEGKIIQIDRTEKQRFAAMIGVYGDGI